MKDSKHLLLLGATTLAGTALGAVNVSADNVYTVQEGDTLTGVAANSNIDLQKLADDNNISADSYLHIGQQLVIKTQDNKEDANVPSASQAIQQAASSSSQASSSSSSSSKDEHKSSSSQQKQESKKDENKKDENKEVQNALPQLESQLGHTLNNGQCYGLTAWYVQQLGGPQLMGSGKSFAQDIGTDYDWSAYGWSVKQYPSIQDIKPGDVINWEAGGALSPGIYGHTGVVVSIDDKGNMTTIEQNAEQGQVAAKYNRTFDQTRIKSVVHKDATSSKTTDKSEAQTTTQNDASKDQAQKQDNNQTQTQNQTNGLSAADAQAKEWIAARESGGSYTAQNGQYYGRYQLTASYLNGDFSPANQERVADQYVASRYGSWSNAQSFWLANGWY